MEYGNLWDLAVISTPEEMQRVVDLTKCSHHAFWVGVKKPWIGSGFRNIFNEPATYLPVSKPFNFELLNCSLASPYRDFLVGNRLPNYKRKGTMR